MPKLTPEEFFKRQEDALDRINKSIYERSKLTQPILSPLDNLTDFERMEIVLQSGVDVPDEVIDDLVEDPDYQYSGHSTLFEPYLTDVEKAIVETLLYRIS